MRLPRLDVPGVALAALGLAGVTYALTEAGNRGWRSPLVLATGAGGVLALAAMGATEMRSRHPMLPSSSFARGSSWPPIS
mgnify:CR=1 FL=1